MIAIPDTYEIISNHENDVPIIILANVLFSSPNISTIRKYCSVSTNNEKPNVDKAITKEGALNIALSRQYIRITTNKSPTCGLIKRSFTNRAIKTSVINKKIVAIK